MRDGLRRTGRRQTTSSPTFFRRLAEALEDGAVGLSTGSHDTPGMYADDDELVALLEVVREHGGFYVLHHRNYGRRALEAYADCIEVLRRAGVPLHFAHAHLGVSDQMVVHRAVRDDRRGGVTTASRSPMDTYPTSRARPTSTRSSRAGCSAGGSGVTILQRFCDPELRHPLPGLDGHQGSDGLPRRHPWTLVDGRHQRRTARGEQALASGLAWATRRHWRTPARSTSSATCSRRRSSACPVSHRATRRTCG